MADFDWNDLKIFDVAARMRSLSGAGRVLGMSQPQVSRRLRQLEDKLGARLFDRTPQGLKYTKAAERLLPLTKIMRDGANAVSRLHPALAGETLGVVRISLDEVRSKVLMLNILRLKRNLQGIELELIEAQTEADHSSRNIELQIRCCLPEIDSLVARRLGTMSFAVYGSMDYVRSCSAARTKKRYTECDWIGMPPDRIWYPELGRWLIEHGVMSTSLRVNTMTAAMDAVCAGAGLALLPCVLADRDQHLVRLTGCDPQLQFAEHVVLHRDILREPAIRKTIDALVDVYRHIGNELEGNLHITAAEQDVEEQYSQ